MLALPGLPRRPRSPARLLQAAIAALWMVGAVQAQSASGILLDDIDTIFAFGDSYTYDGYMPQDGINSWKGIGNTSTGGYNWIQYLTNPASLESESTQLPFETNRSIVLYDLAFSGATVNGSIVEGSEGTPDFVAQVEMFEEYFDPPPQEAAWNANRTLFTIWFGINDVGFSYLKNVDLQAQLPNIFDTFNRQVATLYEAGARNFLIMGVPPSWRTPLVKSYGDAAVGEFMTHVGLFNSALASLSSSLPTLYPGSRVALFDTLSFLSAILDAPAQYGFLEADVFCPAYAELMDMPDAELAQCAWPMREYVWWNAYHPTWAVHKLLAAVIGNTLSNPLPATTTTSLLPSVPGSTGAGVTTLTTLLPSTFIPTTSLTNTVPASAPTVTSTVLSTATGSDGGMGVPGASPSASGGGSNGAAAMGRGGEARRVGVAAAGAVAMAFVW
ncbi:hypothetical protein JCM10207_003787 [Rhodosporidiobolus poonsookiae]